MDFNSTLDKFSILSCNIAIIYMPCSTHNYLCRISNRNIEFNFVISYATNEK